MRHFLTCHPERGAKSTNSCVAAFSWRPLPVLPSWLAAQGKFPSCPLPPSFTASILPPPLTLSSDSYYKVFPLSLQYVSGFTQTHACHGSSQRCNDISLDQTGTGAGSALLRIRCTTAEQWVQTNKKTKALKHAKTGSHHHTSSLVTSGATRVHSDREALSNSSAARTAQTLPLLL